MPEITPHAINFHPDVIGIRNETLVWSPVSDAVRHRVATISLEGASKDEAVHEIWTDIEDTGMSIGVGETFLGGTYISARPTSDSGHDVRALRRDLLTGDLTWREGFKPGSDVLLSADTGRSDLVTSSDAWVTDVLGRVGTRAGVAGVMDAHDTFHFYGVAALFSGQVHAREVELGVVEIDLKSALMSAVAREALTTD